MFSKHILTRIRTLKLLQRFVCAALCKSTPTNGISVAYTYTRQVEGDEMMCSKYEYNRQDCSNNAL